jgi:2-methylcitrate dehydratase PrpD
MAEFDPSPITRTLGQFVASFRVVPAAAMVVACVGIVDVIGLMLGAGVEPVVKAVQRAVGTGASSGYATVLFSARCSRAGDAAFVNTTAAHAFAMDDVAWGTHPSAVLFPALLAVGEQLGASGADLLRAWVVGYEVLAELASRDPDSLHAARWHPSGAARTSRSRCGHMQPPGL